MGAFVGDRRPAILHALASSVLEPWLHTALSGALTNVTGRWRAKRLAEKPRKMRLIGKA